RRHTRFDCDWSSDVCSSDLYYESLPADRLGLAVELEAERMARLVLRDKQVTSEREVVTNERRYRVEDDVEGSANELLYKTAFTRSEERRVGKECRSRWARTD